VHSGDVERRGDHIGGIGVHTAARIRALAKPGEVWVSRVVKDLSAGAGFTFTDRGSHRLEGIDETVPLLAVTV
jgi:class 3 adenylate cyclase